MSKPKISHLKAVAELPFELPPVMHPCNTGDCPHGKQIECDETLARDYAWSLLTAQLLLTELTKAREAQSRIKNELSHYWGLLEQGYFVQEPQHSVLTVIKNLNAEALASLDAAFEWEE